MLRATAIAAAEDAAMAEVEYLRFLAVTAPAVTARAVADEDPADAASWPIPR